MTAAALTRTATRVRLPCTETLINDWAYACCEETGDCPNGTRHREVIGMEKMGYDAVETSRNLDFARGRLESVLAARRRSQPDYVAEVLSAYSAFQKMRTSNGAWQNSRSGDTELLRQAEGILSDHAMFHHHSEDWDDTGTDHFSI